MTLRVEIEEMMMHDEPTASLHFIFASPSCRKAAHNQTPVNRPLAEFGSGMLSCHHQPGPPQTSKPCRAFATQHGSFTLEHALTDIIPTPSKPMAQPTQHSNVFQHSQFTPWLLCASCIDQRKPITCPLRPRLSLGKTPGRPQPRRGSHRTPIFEQPVRT